MTDKNGGNLNIPPDLNSEHNSPQLVVPVNQPIEEKESLISNWTLFRGGLILIFIVIISLNSIYGIFLSHGDVECILDMSFEKTKGINTFFTNNVNYKNYLLIFSSLCVDINLIVMAVLWVVKGKSWRCMLALLMFYGSRAFCQQVFQMRYPPGYLWDYPGFPSLSVSYLRTNDFFFSGHVGLPTIFGLEHKRLGYRLMMWFCVFTVFLEAFTMVATHGHYIIDLMTGVVMAHYLTIIASELCTNYIDNSIIGFSGSDTTKEENPNYKAIPQDDIEKNVL